MLVCRKLLPNQSINQRRESQLSTQSADIDNARAWRRIVITRFASLLSACDRVFPSGRACVHTYVRYSFFLSITVPLFLACAPPLNLEYDRPVVRAIGTNSLAIKLLDGRSEDRLRVERERGRS